MGTTRSLEYPAVFTSNKRFKGDYPHTLHHKCDFLQMKFFFVNKFPQPKKVTWNELQLYLIK